MLQAGLDTDRTGIYHVRMNNGTTFDRVVRVSMTDAQWKAFRVLAVERDQELRELVTAALQTSPLTKKVFV